MKKLLSVILVLTFALILTACGKIEIPSNLSFSDRTLTWDSVKGANKYVVEINGKEYETNANSFTLEDGVYGVLDMRVKAVGSNTSEYSEKVSEFVRWTLATPTGLVQEGANIIWNEVQFALGYVVDIGGYQYLTQTNSYAYQTSNPIAVKVCAYGDEENGLMPSQYTSEITLMASLQTPSLTANKTVVSWQEVLGAGSYEVYLDGALIDTVNTTSYDFKFDFVGSKQVSVKAIAVQGNGYLNSSLSNALTLTLNKETLETPNGLVVENGVLSWNIVNGAKSYAIYNNGELYTTVNANSYQIASELLNANISALQVQTLNEEHISSSLSEIINVGKFSELNPIEIASAEDFSSIEANGHYKLVQNVDLTNYEQIATFGGSLNGNGFKVTGLTTALFGEVNGGKISNLTIENASLTVTTDKDGASVGVLANTLINATVIDCKVLNSTVTVTSSNGVAFVGGVAGLCEYSNISNAKVSVTINTQHATVGGLVGWANNSTKNSVIEKCQVTADITAIGGESSIVGGFIGKLTNNALTVSESLAKVEIETGASYVGGFIGYLGSSREVKDCYAQGEVASTNTEMAHIGGFIGRLEGYNNKVVRCISMATVSVNAQVCNDGGFVGYTVGGSYAGNIYENCYYDNTLANLDRIGNSNGRGDGITAKSTDALKSLSYENGYQDTVWVLGENELPTLVIE